VLARPPAAADRTHVPCHDDIDERIWCRPRNIEEIHQGRPWPKNIDECTKAWPLYIDENKRPWPGIGLPSIDESKRPRPGLGPHGNIEESKWPRARPGLGRHVHIEET
jgi:hypothetical protein